MSAFWKKLRHFYRTGRKPAEHGATQCASPFLDVLGSPESHYPIRPEGEDGPSIPFDTRTPFRILDVVLTKHQKENRKKFKSGLFTLVSGLNELLRIDNTVSEATKMDQTYDFASEMIAFDKMVETVPHASSEELSKGRLERIQEVATTLNDGLANFGDHVGTVILEREAKKRMEKDDILGQANLVIRARDGFAQAQDLFSDRMKNFAELIRAYRIAKLEVEGAYDENIHNEYFQHFTWHRFTGEELDLFHPILLFVDHTYLLDHLSSFSRLLSSNQPINVLVLNHELISTPKDDISWEDASHGLRQEITALTISHRNVYAFQAGMANPDLLFRGVEGCIQSTAPGVCHLSLPSKISKDPELETLQSRASNAGRFFPSLIYNAGEASLRKGRFDLGHNEQPEADWPHFGITANDSNKQETVIDTHFTYADYKSLYPKKMKELMLIPSEYYMEHLVPLSEYLALDETNIYGKIPYIWVVDGEETLQRAAVPNVWVVSCQERLDFWKYLQELAGMHDRPQEQVDVQADATRADEAPANTSPVHDLEKIQEEAMAKAAEKLIGILLDDEELQLDAESGVAGAEVPDPEISDKAQESSVSSTSDTVAPTESIAEAYVDSDDCTSCNDCTDRYPKLFKYNDEKKAYLTDANNGTYEELVKAAENCPAACIHPGQPINKEEPNLDKLMKRAERFN